MKHLKKGIYFFSLCLFLFLMSCSGDHPAQLKPLPSNATIVAFGDSLTFGMGVKEEESYPAILSKLIGYRVINAGIPGETSAQALQRLPIILKNYHPKLVILCIGGNDVLRNIPIEQTKNNLRNIITQIKASGAQVFMLSVPQSRTSYNPPSFFQTIAKEFDIPLENSLIASLLKNNQYKSDWIHFNKMGYQKMAEKIAELLRAYGALPNK